MRGKHVAWVMTAVLVVGVFALPASANKVKDKDGIPGGVKDTGLLFGVATVGKLRDRCLHDGTSTVRGSGVGMPHQTKNAYWELGNAFPAAVESIAQLDRVKFGSVRACGRLTRMLSAVGGGLGASCMAWKGWDGKGTVSYQDEDGDPSTPVKETIWLKELGWKASVSTFVMTGAANQAPTEGESKNKSYQDFIVAVLQEYGGPPCFMKQAGKAKDSQQGARQFNFNGSYTIANGFYIDPNSLPLTCKSGLANGCLYEPKKIGKSG